MKPNAYDVLFSFSKRFKFLRKKRKLSRAELARLSGLTKRSIYDYENCIQLPRLRQLNKIAEALNVMPDYSLSDMEPSASWTA